MVQQAPAGSFLEQPSVSVDAQAPEWGSDVIAEMLRRLGVEYVALNPGASFRGLHDSLVNYNGNVRPGMILCNHEEIAVGVAHGYAKASGRPMGAIVHSNVGLMHATMSIFNAWVDRVPVMVLGATGPMDSTLRRPWIDWVHTSYGQGSIVRDFTKWEHQPASVAAIPEAMLRAWRTMLAEPRGPVYLCFDAGLQEQRLDPARPIELPDPAAYALAAPPPPPPEAVREVARMLAGASFPVLLAGRAARTQRGWDDLVALAEALGAAVLTDFKMPASFPTDHALHQTTPGIRGDEAFYRVLDQADAVLALEWPDVAGTLGGSAESIAGRGSSATGRRRPRLANVTMDDYAVRSWSAEYYAVPAAEVSIAAPVEATVGALLGEVRRYLADDSAGLERADRRLQTHRRRRAELEAEWAAARDAAWGDRPTRIVRYVGELWKALGERQDRVDLVRAPLHWPSGAWEFRHPGAYLGYDGGAGVGSGPGMAIGAALALRGAGRLPVAILGDGDVLMAASALWTAAHHRIPLLIVVANNRSYMNDEIHQERVARKRGRPVENRWVGQRMDEPPVDFAGLARDLGVEGIGPVGDPDDLAEAYGRALRAVEEGRPVLVDVLIARS